MGDQRRAGQNRSGLSEGGLSQNDWGAMGARGQIFHHAQDGHHMRDVRCQCARREQGDPQLRDGRTAGGRRARRWRDARRRFVLGALNDRYRRDDRLLRVAKDDRRAQGARTKPGVRLGLGVSPRDAGALF